MYLMGQWDLLFKGNFQLKLYKLIQDMQVEKKSFHANLTVISFHLLEHVQTSN